ncbi:sensor histidine kinase [Pseudooceanicola sp.]|jgi:signal transduction histidine kinase|uniref:sensor histidine kinase n=1 Tax=Pseudooceanicola sp. TaxID=1914328 RepID=UPI00405A035D
MRVYEFLARRNWPRTYTGKILLVSFVGVHVPMFGAVAYALLADSTPFMEQLDVLIAMLLATLVGTAATMFVMAALLAPVRRASEAAQTYLDTRETPRLPTRYTDGAGVLMASVQEAITRLDAAISVAEAERDATARNHNQKFRMLAGMKHDFRTPLTVILGFADLMKTQAIGEYGGAAYRDYAASIGRSGQDLMQTLQSVLDLSDAEAQREFEAERQPLDLVPLARQAAAQEHFHADRRGVSVEIDTPKGVVVDTVPAAARDMIAVMLQTAIARVPEGGRVRLVLDGSGAHAVTVEATDAVLTTEDLPASLSTVASGLESGTGEDGTTGAATPTTLRLSLIDTFCHAMNAKLEVDQSGERFRLRVALDAGAPALKIAAE